MSQTTFSIGTAGSLASNSQTNWNDLQTALTGTVSAGTTIKIEAQSWREGSRAVVIFDTSSLADNVTVSAAVLRMTTDFKVSGFGGTLYARAMTTSSDTSISTGDYNKTNFGSSVGSIGWSSIGSSGSNDISITTSHISKTGYTKIGLIHSNDYDNSDPGNGAGNSYARFTTPQLIITWTTPPVVTTGASSDITHTTATLAGNVTDAGGGTVTSRGVCWATTSNPTTSSSKATSAGTTGAFTVSATGLTKNTTYHFRAFVTTENSTTYGSDQTFTTDVEPTVTTQAVSDISVVTATGNGNVTADGNATVTERGICYKTSTGPTISDSKVVVAGTTGAFTASMTSLTPGKKYYVKAYATNAVGTSYGAEVTFTTFSPALLFLEQL